MPQSLIRRSGAFRATAGPLPLSPLLRLVMLAALLPSLGGCLAASYGVSKLRPEPPLREFVLELGPLDLPANAAHHESPQPVPVQVAFPVDAWMRGFAVEVVDAQGDTVPSGVLHHLKLMMPRKRDLFSPLMLRLVGAGSETRAAQMPRILGFPMQRGDSLLLTAMVHNPTASRYDGVKIRLRLTYNPAATARPPTIVYPFFAHVAAPGEPSSYDLPPGRSERSWEIQPAIAGYVLGFGGHLHRYGVALRLEDVTTGEVLWSGRAKRDAEGHVLEIERKLFAWSRGIYIRPDRTYRIVAIYDNPAGETLVDAGMGTVAGIFQPVQPWPAAERGHPLYIWDYSREVSGESSQHHGHHD